MNTRRQFLSAAASVAGLASANGLAHSVAGWVRPSRGVPNVQVSLADGRAVMLGDLLRGRTTALQLMFTGCSSTCPLQGALFAQVQARLAAASPPMGRVQLVSLSVDPLADHPAAMAKWLRQFDAGPQWQGAIPQVKDVDLLLDFFNGRAAGLDWHANAVFMVNAAAHLVLRSVDHPAPSEVVRWLAELASVGSRRG